MEGCVNKTASFIDGTLMVFASFIDGTLIGLNSGFFEYNKRLSRSLKISLSFKIIKSI